MMSLYTISIMLVLFLSTYVAAQNSYPPCRYNCPDSEKLVCGTLNGEYRTFANRCQLELFNCTTQTRPGWKIVKKGACDIEK